ncbi:MAG: hypothetical protein IKI09_10795 [Bacteroidales bacterium]|nr:hypothetical protein [Bacteroidales bacterium]
MNIRQKHLATLVLAIAAALLAGCKKDNNASNNKQNTDQVLTDAISFSKNHDEFVYRYLKKSEAFQSNKHDSIGMESTIALLQEMTGLPITVIDDVSQLDGEYMVLDLDAYMEQECIKLENYSTTSLVRNHFKSVDRVLENDSLSLQETILALDVIEGLVMNDGEANDEEKETLLRGIEVLKGSLLLWENVGMHGEKAHPSQWPIWKKLLFVAGCDAIGAVVGYFVGGIVTYMGASYYVPPTGSGAVAMAGVFSIMAAKYVKLIN